MKLDDIESYIKKNYNMAVGEMTKDAVKQRIAAISREKLKVRGRSYMTGRKKTVHIPIANLLKT